MNGWVADLVDQETADKVGKCWGLGSDTPKDPGPWEGEQATCGSRLKQRTSGSTAATSSVAPLLAVPVAAVEGADGGNPDAVYGLQTVHHKR